jgi:hypothetical protein
MFAVRRFCVMLNFLPAFSFVTVLCSASYSLFLVAVARRRILQDWTLRGWAHGTFPDSRVSIVFAKWSFAGRTRGLKCMYVWLDSGRDVAAQCAEYAGLPALVVCLWCEL